MIILSLFLYLSYFYFHLFRPFIFFNRSEFYEMLIDSFNTNIYPLLFINRFLQSRVYGEGKCLIGHENRVGHNDICTPQLMLQVLASSVDIILEYQTLEVMGLPEEQFI